MAFIHFESKDFDTFRSQGKFWHSISVEGSIFVDQGDGIWTLHKMLPPGVDEVTVADPYQVIAAAVGGLSGPVPVKVDRILVRGKWSSRLSIATNFRSPNGRVFLTGDAGEWLFMQHNVTRAHANSASAGAHGRPRSQHRHLRRVGYKLEACRYIGRLGRATNPGII